MAMERLHALPGLHPHREVGILLECPGRLDCLPPLRRRGCIACCLLGRTVDRQGLIIATTSVASNSKHWQWLCPAHLLTPLA